MLLLDLRRRWAARDECYVRRSRLTTEMSETVRLWRAIEAQAIADDNDRAVAIFEARTWAPPWPERRLR